MPKYITPEKFEHSVEMIRQIGSIQTELNILNPLIAITKTQFTLAKFEYLQKCHISYKPAIVSLGTLIENAKMRVNSEIDKFGGNYLKDLTDSVFTKHKILKQNYDKNEVFLQKAETYLTVFHEEVKWINSRLENDEIKFDSSENSLNALKMFEKLEQEVRDREESYQKVINDGKEYILKNNKNTAEEFINLLEDKWKQLQEHIEFYATIFRKVRKAVECGNKATVIREWIK
uniref:BAR domain-containing protein n=1 Tax=Panagrolaimus superbus TaxID=310955 RepID=A0A914YQG1_9BILA